MSADRFNRGFEPVGRIRPDELGLPKKRAKELLLAVAWRRVAGEALAERVAARRVLRGVLEVEPLEPRVAETLRALLPEIAGRIAADFPALGIRKCRLIGAGGEAAGSPALEIAEAGGPPKRSPRR